jgi:hypothetical protein
MATQHQAMKEKAALHHVDFLLPPSLHACFGRPFFAKGF